MLRLKQRLMILAAATMYACGSDVSQVPHWPAPLPSGPTFFADPSASLEGVTLDRAVYVAPFARIRGTGSTGVRVGAESNIQDNVIVEGEVTIGDRVILAHGCTVQGPARLGASGGDPAFVGFNARVEGATIEPDSMVGIRARVGPGLTLRSGRKVLPGRNVTTQEEADRIELGKVAAVTDADRRFMRGVLAVNIDLVAGYLQMQATSPLSLRGIGPDPTTDLHPQQIRPTLGGRAELDPTFPNRIIGDVHMADPLAVLLQRMGLRDSLRADEGGPFHFGTLASMADEVTVHALEHSEVAVGNQLRAGRRVVIHGGEDANNRPPERTQIGNDVTIADGAVVFRSTVGDGCLIGEGALVDGCQLAPGTVVPPGTILIQNQNQGTVEW